MNACNATQLFQCSSRSPLWTDSQLNYINARHGPLSKPDSSHINHYSSMATHHETQQCSLSINWSQLNINSTISCIIIIKLIKSIYSHQTKSNNLIKYPTVPFNHQKVTLSQKLIWNSQLCTIILVKHNQGMLSTDSLIAQILLAKRGLQKN